MMSFLIQLSVSYSQEIHSTGLRGQTRDITRAMTELLFTKMHVARQRFRGD